MSLITINTKQVSGALFNEKNGRELFVARNTKSPVIMTGYVGAGEVKGEDGKYSPTEYGRLTMEAALAGEGDNSRLVLSIGGGALRGVLFRAKKDGVNYDYQGMIEDGNGFEYPVFGRKIDGERGQFIALSSMDKAKREENGSASNAPARKEHEAVPAEQDEGLPF
ncbi:MULTISPECIES: hypothetical protein [Ralstonia]|jgi:hypothetical protein|uniref:Uncharacterized protein n=4 Tax=Pseudomonadota TaxID=1224 RepID=A0AAD2BT55_9RALS|nr:MULTISPECIES: hypothetical protein [Ralstonia]NOZ17889.1 hypothetical protein [Betaproteobacteria bacterium]AJW47690.1 hypothetical protein TK49_23575 [Ralstonia mannitolilytica]MBA9871341.1 hypothetical protein [Ralstonia insidiosa]MBA9915596.1 hypothetical protein [Ralstonia insidiosa]MBA9954587.1 hypothetical protein [Ralstonia insidiosa]